MDMRIRKAVLPVAGLGTRFLPATKAMPKELLPIIDKPLVQYAVEEAVAAGIRELVFVTGRTKRAIEDHFDADPALEQALEAAGKPQLAEEIRTILPEGVSCVFIRQPRPMGLGHAVLCAERAVAGEPFAVLLADDVIRARILPTTRLVEAHAQAPATYLSVMDVAPSESRHYGMVVPGRAPGSVAGLMEKPAPGRSPSEQASIGRYVLEPEIFEVLRRQAPGAGGEIQLSDAIDTLARRGGVRAVPLEGMRYDCGSRFGYLTAVVDMALEHPVHGAAFADLLRRRLLRMERRVDRKLA